MRTDHDKTKSELLMEIAALRHQLLASRAADVQALRDNEQRLQMALHAANAATWSVDLRTNYTYWSDEFYRLVGLDPARHPATQELWASLLHPDNRNLVLPEVYELLNENRGFDVELRIIRPDGSIRWLQDIGQIEYDDKGNPQRAIGIILDITERKRSEENLYRLNRAYRMLSYCNQAIIWAENEQTLLETACHVIVDYGQYRVACIAVRENTSERTLRPIAAAGNKADKMEGAPVIWDDIPPQGTPVSPYLVRDLRQDTSRDWDQRAIKQGCTTLIALPLVVAGKVFAVLQVCTGDEQGFTQEEIDTLVEVANNLNYAITALHTRADRERAEQGERELRRRAEAFTNITLALASHISLDELLDEILEQAQHLVPYKSGNISLIDGDNLWIKHWRGYPDDELIRSLRQTLSMLPLNQEVVSTRKPMVLSDTHREPRWRIMPGLEWIRSYIGVPIVVQGNVLGMVRLDSDVVGQFSEQDIERLSPLVSAAGIALENANLYEQAQQEIAARREVQDSLQKLNYELEQRVRLRTQEYLHSKQRMETILDSSSDGILFAYPDTGIQQTNRAFNTLFNCQDDDYFDQPMTALVRPEDRLLLAALLEAVLEDGVTRRLEIVMVRKDGTTFDGEVGIAYMKWSNVEEGVVCSLRDISLRKQFEAALRSSEAQMRAILNGTFTYIGLLKPDGTVILGNKAALEAIGINDAEQIIGMPFWELSVWNDEAGRQQLIDSIRRAGQGEFMRYETEIVTVNGVVTMDFSISPIKDEKGQVILLVPEGRDISEKKRAEDTLRRTTDQLQSILDNSTAMIYITDLQERSMMMNRQSRMVFNLTPEEVVGRRMTGMLPEETLAQLFANNRQVVESRTTMEFEEVTPHADGLHTYLSIKSPLFDEHGNVYAICGISTDITERKKTEEQLRYHAELLDKVSDAVISTDSRFIVRSWNRAAEVIYGWSAEEAIGRRLNDLLDTQYVLESQTTENVKSKFLEEGYWSGEVTQLRKDGTRVHILSSVALLKDENGVPLGNVGVNHDITERKQAEEAIKRSEADLRSVFESAPLGLVLLDRDLKIRAVNTVAQRMRKSIAGDKLVIGKDAPAYFSAQGMDSNLQMLQQALAGKTQDIEISFVVGQTHYYFHNIFNPVITADGEVIGICMTGEDITERKQVEEAIKRSEADLRSVFESAPLGLVLLDRDLKIRAVNSVTQRMRQSIGREEMVVGEKAARYILPEVLDANLQVMQEALAGEAKAAETAYVVGQDYHYFHNTYNPVITGDGEIIGICVTGEDISERKRAEEAIKRSEADLRSVFDSTPLALILLDTDLNVRAANTVAQRMTREVTNEDMMIGESVLHYVPPGSEQGYRAILERSLAGEMQNLEISYEEAHGSYFFHMTYNPVTTGDGTVIGICVTSEDITERKRSEIRLREALERQKELSELKSRFVSMASHEFRTPLATMQAASDALKAYLHKMTPEQVEHRLNKIQNQIKHMTQLLTDVLTLEQIQLGKLQYQPVDFDLIAFCRETIDELQSDRQHRVVFDTALDRLSLFADEKLIRQVLVNILTNALKYSPPEQPVELGLHIEGKNAVLTIRDYGIGIPEKDQEHLFEPFYRATNVGTTSGSGLGLVIAKQAVDLHHGSMTFVSESGVGTTFTVMIPQAAEIK